MCKNYFTAQICCTQLFMFKVYMFKVSRSKKRTSDTQKTSCKIIE